MCCVVCRFFNYNQLDIHFLLFYELLNTEYVQVKSVDYIAVFHMLLYAQFYTIIPGAVDQV